MLRRVEVVSAASYHTLYQAQTTDAVVALRDIIQSEKQQGQKERNSGDLQLD